MSMKHTPGPWIVANGLQIWRGSPSVLSSPRICTLQNGASVIEQIPHEEMQANAKLIVSAPELYAALKAVEWSGIDVVIDCEYSCCPNCGGLSAEPVAMDPYNRKKQRVGHHPECQLNAALLKAEGREP